MSLVCLIDGLGETAGGDGLVSAVPIEACSLNVLYVNSATGSNGATRGRDRSKPLATLKYAAETLGAPGNIIVLMPGHTETLAADLTIDDAHTVIVGAGTGDLRPRLIVPIDYTVAITVTGVSLRNVRVANATGTATAGVVTLTEGTNTLISGCYFDFTVANSHAGSGVCLLASLGLPTHLRVTNTQFVANGATSSITPTPAIYAATGALAMVELNGVTFDGGQYGWDGYAMDLAAGATTICRAQSMGLVRGSDVFLHSSSPSWVQAQLATAGGRVVWGTR